MNYDFIIVGHGIAGAVLADHLMKSNYTVLVINEPSLSNSSKVAGGLFNPITGRKMVKTWRADDLFDYLIPYYQHLEIEWEADFFHNKPIYRPFYSNEELNEWMGKSADPHYTPYVKEVFGVSHYGQHIQDDFGGLLLNRCGYMDTMSFLAASEKRLIEKGSYSEAYFDFSKLELEEGGVNYQIDSAAKIIFADGQLLEKNTFFNWLPLRRVKGELLYIRVEEAIDVIYNRGVFVVPQQDGIFKVGSTYDHQNLDDNTTEEAKVELTRRLKELIKIQFEIIDQKAGVRPATKDRKPFIGTHPDHEQICVFNGFGTKGVSLVPYFANQFVKALTGHHEVEPEVNISRFFSLY